MTIPTCKDCGSVEVRITEQIFCNNTKHLKANCGICDKFLRYVPQEIDPGDMVLPLGKHKGKTIAHVYLVDHGYLLWAVQNFKGSIQRRIRDFLSKPRQRY